MKVAVIGSAGQLGRDLCPRLRCKVLPLTRENVDLTRSETIPVMLDQHQPDVIINCAAYNFVDKAETEPEAAMAVNAWAVRDLARHCHQRRIRFIQISSDYVFGGDHEIRRPMNEFTRTAPVSVYGLSKLSGEFLARMYCPSAVVVRTCGLYGVWGSGGKGGNFVETMLRLGGQGKPLRVVHDQICTPSYTQDVARAIAALVENPAAEGIYHVTNAGGCNWYEFASEIFRLAGLKVDLTPITSEQFGAPAKRPPYSVLENHRLVEAGVALPRPWQEALAAYLEEREKKPSAG